jgi:tetratricopeptide (TPR) repeat protein
MSEKGISDDLNTLLSIAVKAYDECQDCRKDPIDYAHLCNTYGVVKHNQGEFVAAREYLLQCYDTRSQSANPDLKEIANVFNNLGIVAFSVLDYEEAVSYHQKAEVIRMAEGDDWATAKGMTHLNMGRALWRLNQKQEAWKRLKLAIEQFEISGNWYLRAQ